MLLAMTTLLMTLAAAAPADLKGKWDGTVSAPRADGSTDEDTVLLVLDQKDKAVTGTIGGNENDQHPITEGTIDGSKVTILAKHAGNGREFRLELTLAGEELKGTVTSGERRGTVHARRRKD
jgi:hypothetical protein